MKLSLFIICFSCLASRYYLITVPEDKPHMYYDGTEWRTMKPNRNATSGTRRPNLSAFLDTLLNISNSASPSDTDTDLDINTTPQAIIARVFDENIRHISENQNATKEIGKFNLTTDIDKPDYSSVLTHLINDTETIKNNLRDAAPTANLTNDPADWIKVMLDLSMTLKEIVQRQNGTYFTQTHKNNTTNVTETTIQSSSLSTLSSSSEPVTISTNATIRNRKINKVENRRTMDGLDEILALLTGDIEIDNGSESSDEINKDNKKYMNKALSPKSQVREIHSQLNKDNNYMDRDSESGDLVSDGVEETRFVLVEDKSGERVKLRNN